MGDFYLLEGGMATGKTTTLDHLSSIALQEDIGASFNKTPLEEYSAPRNQIYEEEDTRTKAMWYLWHSCPVSDWIEEELEDGNDVFLDRYWPTTAAYYNNVDADLVEIVNQMNVVEPDKVYFLTADEDTRAERMDQRKRDDSNRAEEKASENAALNEYRRILQSFDTTEIQTDDKRPERIAYQIAQDVDWL